MQYHWIVTAVVPLIGVIGAGLLSYFTAANTVSYQARITQAAAAYADYLTAVAKLAQTDGDKIYVRAEYAAAKARIAVYGTPEVISSMAEFHREGASTDANRDLFLKIAIEMRKHTWGKKQSIRKKREGLSEDIEVLIFGPTS